MLTYGAMPGNHTYLTGVKRLLAGEMLLAKPDAPLSLIRYIDYNAIPVSNRSNDQLIADLEERFTPALKMEMDKDAEAGYQSIATLSGGLDSRLVVMLAHKMGHRVHPFCSFHRSRVARTKSPRIGAGTMNASRTGTPRQEHRAGSGSRGWTVAGRSARTAFVSLP